MKILTSDNVVGCRIKDRIYLHPKLKEQPRLYNAILKHEKKHGDNFKASDFFEDLFNDDLKECKREYYMFILKHPKTLLGFLPISKIGGNWVVDISMLIFFLFVIAFITTLIYIGLL